MNLKSLLIICLLMIAFGTGCSPKYQQADLSDDPSVKLDISQSVVISKPRGVNSNIRGSEPANELKRAFSRHIKTVVMSPCTNVEQCLEQADGHYLIMTDVFQWGDPMEMPGLVNIPFSTEIRIMVIDMATGTRLRSMVFKASSRGEILGGDLSENLIEQPIKKFIDSLYIP